MIFQVYVVVGFEMAYIGTKIVYLSKGNSRSNIKYEKRFPCWFTCPIQSHNDISCMSYHRLSWFTLSFVESLVRLRKCTCHLLVFLLRVSISLLASKCLAWQSPTPSVVIHFRQTIPPQLQLKISTVCLFTAKGSKFFKKFPLKIFNSGRTWSNLL